MAKYYSVQVAIEVEEVKLEYEVVKVSETNIIEVF